MHWHYACPGALTSIAFRNKRTREKHAPDGQNPGRAPVLRKVGRARHPTRNSAPHIERVLRGVQL